MPLAPTVNENGGGGGGYLFSHQTIPWRDG